MSDDILRYTDLAAIIQLAKSKGMTNAEIVRVLIQNESYEDARETAKKAAPLLDLTVAEFMRLRKND